MDRNNRGGAKPGGGFMMSNVETKLTLRERQKQLKVLDLSKDPYFYKTVNSTYECKLCLTSHNTEGNYLDHTNGKQHKNNLYKRQLKETKEKIIVEKNNTQKKKNIIKIGLPGYKILKDKDLKSNQYNLFIEIYYDKIYSDTKPKHKIISCYEQKLEEPDPNYQYILFAANPYETIAIKIPNKKLDISDDKFKVIWNNKTKIFSMKIYFKN